MLSDRKETTGTKREHEEPWHLNSHQTRKAEGEEQSKREPRQSRDPGAIGEKCLHIKYLKLLKRKRLLAGAARKLRETGQHS